MSFFYTESEERPWGRYYVVHDEPNYKVKRIEVEPNQRLSYQFHHKRNETWCIVQGEATVTIDEVELIYGVNDTVRIPLMAKHRVANKSTELLVFIEIQTGEYFGEDDIVRIEDDYKRK